MDEDVGVAVGGGERTEILDIVMHVMWSAVWWFLVALTTIKLIVSWFIDNIINLSSGIFRSSTIPEATRAFLTHLWKILSVLLLAPGMVLAIVLKLYHGVRRAGVGCFRVCQSVPLQKDDLCEKLCVGVIACVNWARRYNFNMDTCYHPWVRISRCLHRVHQVCIGRIQVHCPTLYEVLSRFSIAVRSSGVTAYLVYAFSNLPRLLLACLHRTWMFIVRGLVAVTGILSMRLGQVMAFSKRSCQRETSGEMTSDLSFTWTRLGQDICSLGERLEFPSSMTRCRMSHFRCSPRSGFYAILVFVAFTFALMTYFYSGGFVDVAEQNKNTKHQGLEQRDNVVSMGQQPGHQFGMDRQKDRPINSWNRHKSQHIRKGHPKDDDFQQLSTPRMKQVLDVINLMSRMRTPNQTSNMTVQKQILRIQINLLKEAMISVHTMLPKPSKPLACVGNLQPGEVEDILCIPRPKFLSHIKNPCWYAGNGSIEGGMSLHCLPYFHILGCAKSGTTDLWNRLMSHPHTVSNDGLLHKEALWWSWYRYGISGYSRKKMVVNFSDYVNLFQDTARQIQASIDKESLFHQILITGDASPPDFWDFRGWTNISQNRHSDVAVVTTPHLMRHFYANPKFIIMFRDPIDRLYSDYFFVGLGLTAQDFHNDILASVDMLAKCVAQHGLQRCFHDHELYVKLPVRLPFACYSVFMREWLQVFPLDNFLFIKTEEYENNPEDTLKSVMEFLGLGPLKDTQLQVIAEEERSRVTMQRKIAGPMQNATKILLEDLLGVCNKELARLIKSDKFTWTT